MSFAGGHTKASPNKSLLNAKRQKEDKSMYGRKEASKQVQIRKNPVINPSFFSGAPNLHKLGLSPNILHFDSWLLGCRLRRACALISHEVEANMTTLLQTRYLNCTQAINCGKLIGYRCLRLLQPRLLLRKLDNVAK